MEKSGEERSSSSKQRHEEILSLSDLTDLTCPTLWGMIWQRRKSDPAKKVKRVELGGSSTSEEMRDVIPLSQKSYVLNIWQFLATCNRKNHEQKKASVALLIGTQGENKKQKNCFNWAPIIVACLQLLWLNLTRSAKHASNTGAGSNQPAFCIFGPMGQPPWHVWSHGSTTLAWEFVEIHPFPACRAVRRSSQWGRFCCLTAFCFVILALIQILCYAENTHLPSLCWRYIDTTADKGKHS